MYFGGGGGSYGYDDGDGNDYGCDADGNNYYGNDDYDNDDYCMWGHRQQQQFQRQKKSVRKTKKGCTRYGSSRNNRYCDNDYYYNERDEEEVEEEEEMEEDDELFDDENDRNVEFDISNPWRHRAVKRPARSYGSPKPEKKSFLFQLMPGLKSKLKPKAKPDPPKTTQVIATETTIVAGPSKLFKKEPEECLKKTSKSLEGQQRVAAVYKRKYGGLDSWTSLRSAGTAETVIQDIPDHVILNILKFIDPRDVVELRCTCKHIDFIMYNNKWFWEEFCRAQFGELDKKQIVMSLFDGVTVDWELTFKHNFKAQKQRIAQEKQKERDMEAMSVCPSCGKRLLATKTYSRNVSSYVFNNCIGCGYSEQYGTELHPFKI